MFASLFDILFLFDVTIYFLDVDDEYDEQYSEDESESDKKPSKHITEKAKRKTEKTLLFLLLVSSFQTLVESGVRQRASPTSPKKRLSDMQTLS